jgi:two-component system invasion response regulator UvrY
MIKVLIVDDHSIVRQGLRRILGDARGIEVGAEAANGVEALKKLRAGKFDIVLLDISMPEKNGFDTLKQIMDSDSGARVLILTMYPEDQYAVRLMKAGASGYMTKDTAPEQLIEAVRNIMAGQKFISRTLAQLLLDECGTDSSKPSHELLSDREYQVMRLLGSGQKVSEVAKTLSLSAKTVSTHRAHILEKMKLRNNAELTYYVVENGLREQVPAGSGK